MFFNPVLSNVVFVVDNRWFTCSHADEALCRALRISVAQTRLFAAPNNLLVFQAAFKDFSVEMAKIQLRPTNVLVNGRPVLIFMGCRFPGTKYR
jgi:hypothetical protein